MRIVINLPHVFLADSTPTENGRALRPMLDCMVGLNIGYLKDHGSKIPEIYKAGIIYGRTTWWEPIPAVMERGYGDCKSLAPWLIAQYRMQRIPCEPVFRWVKNKSGGIDYHILVQTERGFEDPSRVLGMGANENSRAASNRPRKEGDL